MATTIQIKTAIDTAGSAKSVQELRKAIKQLEAVGLQLGDQTSKEFKQIAGAVGDAKERIEDLRDDFVAFQGSALEKFNGGLTVAREKLQNLEFDEVSKQLGNLGKIVAANPLLFLSKAVIELIENFESLKGSGGLVGEAFELVGVIIDGLIDLFKKIGDAIGLTAFEAQEASERIIESYKRVNDQLAINYDNQIKLARAAGRETVNIEIEKQKAIIESQKAIGAELLKRVLVDGRRATDEERKQYKEVLDTIRASVVELEVLRLSENQKRLEEQKKTSDEILANELKLQQQIQDIRNQEIKDEFDRNAAILKTNAERDIQEIVALKAREETKRTARLEVEKKLNIDLEANEKARQESLNKIVEDARKEQEKIIKDSLVRIDEEETKLDTTQNERNKKAAADAVALEKYKTDAALQYGTELLKFGDFVLQKQLENNRRETEDALAQNQRRLEGRNKSLESQLGAEEISEADFKRKQLEAQKSFQAQELKIKKQAFEEEKRQKIALIGINLVAELSAIAANAAANPTNALTFGGAGITQAAILGALAIAKAAINTAQIRQQKFAKGGILKGPSHANGGITTPFGEMEGGEAVINKAATKQYKPLLSAINASTGGVRFALGGVTSNEQAQIAAAQESIINSGAPSIKAYVVQSEMVEQNKKVAKIQNRNGI